MSKQTSMDDGLSLTLGCQQIHAAALKSDKFLKKILEQNNSTQHLEEKDRLGRTPLIYAVLGNNLETLFLLLKSGARTDNGDSFGQTALHWAAFKGYCSCCKLLLSYGAQWKQTDSDKVTPLHLSVRNSNTKCLQLFLQEAVPQNYDLRDNSKKTPLHWSAASGSIEHLKLLLKKDANVNIPDIEGKTPLHWAATLNNPTAVECVKALLEASPSVIGWQDYEGKTALHLAVMMGTTEVVDALTQSRKALDLLDNMFRSALHWASLLGFTDKVSLLLDRRGNYLTRDSNGATALHYAVHGNNVKTVGTFLSHSFVVDEPDHKGNTAFLWAAARGANDIIRIIVEQSSVSLAVTDKNKMSALHAASYYGHHSTVEQLLALGCDSEARNATEMTPLLTACEMGKAKVAKVLLERGADINARDTNGRTALHCSCIGGHAYICQFLISNHLSCNLQDSFGFTPLHYSCLKGYANCTSILLENNADSKIVDNIGQTPFHWSCLKGRREIVRLLVNYGANPSILSLTDEKKTPLDCAVKKEQKEIVRFLLSEGALLSQDIFHYAAIVIQRFFKKYHKVTNTKIRSSTKDSDANKFGKLNFKSENTKGLEDANWPQCDSSATISNNEKSPESVCPLCLQAVRYNSANSSLKRLPNSTMLRNIAAIIIQKYWKNYKRKQKHLT